MNNDVIDLTMVEDNVMDMADENVDVINLVEDMDMADENVDVINLVEDMDMADENVDIIDLTVDDVKPKAYLGVDISSVDTGYCLYSGEVLAWGVIENPKLSLQDYCKAIMDIMHGLFLQFKEHYDVFFIVEQYLSGFRFGYSNTKSITDLISLNSMVQGALMMKVGCKPRTVHPNTPRAYVGIRTTQRNDSGSSIKEQVVAFVEARRSLSEFNKRKRHNIADAYILAYWAFDANI